MSDNDEPPPSKFIDQYKNYGRTESALQEERRLRLLEKQKQSRQDELDAGRLGLLEELEADHHGQEDSMECQESHQRSSKKRPKFIISKLFANKVQLSEWMHESPPDMENWFAVPCPIGQRCLLVFRNHVAVAYNKRGRSIASIHTNLEHMRGTIVLDCVLAKNRVFYILDALAFPQVDLVNCDCQFRFTWIESQFHEKNLAQQFNAKATKQKASSFQLSLLPVYDLAQPESMTSCWARYPAFSDDNPRLDGFLFYHKESHYVYGQTPLVTWLFPFMLNDVLKLPAGLVNEHYLVAKPASYTGDYAAYIKEFDRLQQLRRRRPRSKRTNAQKMDTTNESVPDTTLWEAMEAAPLDSDDEDLRPTEQERMRQLEMEG